jgi:mono/diheme cytochrome c family protein
MAGRETRTPKSLIGFLTHDVWVAIALALIVLGIATILQPVPTLDGDPVKGMSLYQTNCTQCHTEQGVGGVRVGDAVAADIRWPALAPTLNGPALIRRAMLSGVDDRGNELDTHMPRFRGRLIDAEVDNIVAFLETLG